MTEVTRNVSELTALEIREHLLSGQESVEEFTVKLGCFIDAADERIKAFAHRDDRIVAMQAEQLHRERASGQMPGPKD
ncbi:MAG: hypothetical protein QMB14_07245, partial [Polaromonas sp.]